MGRVYKDMRYLVIIMLLCSGYQSCLNLDVVLLVDTSASVFNSQAFINAAIKTFRDRFEGTDVNVGVVTFSDKAELRAQLGDPILVHVFPAGTTNMLEGLRVSLNELYGPRGRSGVQKIIVLISDGQVDEHYQCATLMNEVKNMGVKIIGVQVGDGNKFLENNCSDYVKSDYEGLADELKKLDVCL